MKLPFFILCFSIMIHSQNAFSVSMDDDIEDIPVGTKIVLQKDVIISTNKKWVKLAKRWWDGGDHAEGWTFIKFNPVSHERIMRKGKVLEVTGASIGKEEHCNEDIDQDYNWAKIYVNHPAIKYIWISNGTYTPWENKCSFVHIKIGDLHLDGNSGKYFKLTFPGIEEI